MENGLVGTNKPAGSLLNDHRIPAVLFLDLNPNDTLFATTPSSDFRLIFQRGSRTPT